MYQQLFSYGPNVLAMIGTFPYLLHIMAGSELTSVTTTGAIAGLGQHVVEVSTYEAQLIGLVGLIFLHPSYNYGYAYYY